jgi:hypothetical protein
MHWTLQLSRVLVIGPMSDEALQRVCTSRITHVAEVFMVSGEEEGG